jgi:ERF superfamily protein
MEGIATTPFACSAEFATILGALALAQKTITGAAKDKNNPHFGQAYADLGSIWEACRDALTSNDIAVVQLPSVANGKVSVITVLGHKSGQWISSTLDMTPQQNTPQAVGSAITYARKYALAAMAGVAPEDDDGNAASAQPTNGKQQPAKREARQPEPDATHKQDPIKVVKAEVPEEVQAIWDTMTNADTSQKALMKLVNQAASLDGAQALIDSELAKRKIESLNTIPDKKAYAALAWVIWKFINKPQTAAPKASGLTLAKFHQHDQTRVLAALKKAKGWNQAQVELWLSTFTEGMARAVEVADGMLFEFEMQGQAVSA